MTKKKIGRPTIRADGRPLTDAERQQRYKARKKIAKATGTTDFDARAILEEIAMGVTQKNMNKPPDYHHRMKAIELLYTHFPPPVEDTVKIQAKKNAQAEIDAVS